MAVKPLTKSQICKSCGAEVRSGSLFCYGCGSAVAPEVQGIEAERNGKSVTLNLEKDSLPIAKPIAENAGIKSNQGSVNQPPLKTAAEIRGQEKAPLRKNIEVVWEEPQSSVNIWFILTALILIIFAVVAVYVMLYLR